MNTTAQKVKTTKSLIAFSETQQSGLAITDKLNTKNGEISHESCKTHLEFTVQYEGYWFALHADQQGGFAILRIHAILGHLPFSYQSTFARKNVMAVVRAASKHLNARIRTDEHQRIILIHHIRTKGILNPKLILTETAKVLLQLKPYLQLVTTLQPAKFKEN